MLDLDPELVRKALAESPEASMVSVQRSDGSRTLLSRAMAEWLVSTAPAPNEADLDLLFEGATRARVVDRTSVWGEPPADPGGETVHADVTDPAALAELRVALRIADTGGHMMMTTSCALEISGPEGLRAYLGVMQLSLIRWQGRWHTDAQLLEPWALAEWIAKYGSDEPLRQARERVAVEMRRAEEELRRRQAWEDAMPAPLQAVWSRVEEETRQMVPPDLDVSEAVSALQAAAADSQLLLRGLFSWAGLGLHETSGWYSEELVGMMIIRAFASDDEIVACLGSEPAPAVIAGVSRFLRWQRGQLSGPPRTRAKRRGKAQHEELVRRLLAACPSLGEA